MLRSNHSAMHLILVGPDGQMVRYDGQAVPHGEALRAFLAHGWRANDRGLHDSPDAHGAAGRSGRRR
jgi:hypothetical protein